MTLLHRTVPALPVGPPFFLRLWDPGAGGLHLQNLVQGSYPFSHSLHLPLSVSHAPEARGRRYGSKQTDEMCPLRGLAFLVRDRQ